MRTNLFLAAAAGMAAMALAAGCGDGEEGGGGGTGGGGTGGGGTDGGGTGGAGGGPGCYSATFTTPASGANLTSANDLDGDCSNGINVNVVVATNAPNGTAATLLAGTQELGTTTASAALLKFDDISLQSSGSTKLTLRFDDHPSCDSSIDITQSCGAECSISKPVLSLTHPKLNGVPVAEGGDRVSAPGQDYQAAFEVTTGIEDGQPVTLTVDGKTQVAVALAQSGVATFPGVTLLPDGDHKVQAVCQPKVGQAGSSAEVTYPVDTTPPELNNTAPAAGHFFGPTDDTNSAKSGLQFKVCGETTASDAIDLPVSLGGAENNFCVGIGSATPSCVAAKTAAVGGASGACVELDCPGGAPFDLSLTLRDDAGNPTKATIQGVRCASSLPSVQIVEPVDGTGSDVTKHILSATATQLRKDQDAAKAGAQYTVVACTDVASGSAELLTGLVGGTAKAWPTKATPTAAQASDNCPSGLGYVLKFTNADLDESAETGTGTLATATELKVKVTDVSTAEGTSPAVAVWVDSVDPTISEFLPNPLCGKQFQSATAVQQQVGFVATAAPIDVAIAGPSSTTQFPNQGTQPGTIYLGNVTFDVGNSTVTATTKDPAGNAGALKSPCVVTVGNPPVVTWVAPASATPLNASTDGNAGTAGWQGALTVQTDVGGSGGTVSFTYDCGGTVTQLGQSNIDAAGVATLASATLPECAANGKLTATTSSITGKGIGTAALNKIVDTIVPGAPTALVASVKDRRATTFGLTWTAPADGGQTVGGYQVRVSKAPITGANFDSAEAVAFGGAPKAPGGAESIDVLNRIIENDHYFAIAATDAAGNRSAVVSAGPTKATFNATILAGAADEGYGFSIDGSASINGDSLADLIVGTRYGVTARAYFGQASGYAATPNVTFTGVTGTAFGYSVAVVGDIDSDGLPDVAIGARLEAGRGRVYVYKGRATWPANLTSSQADYIIDVDPVADVGFSSSSFGWSMVPLGDFDGDGAADFAVGAYLYGGGRGYVAVIRGVPTGQTFPATVTLPAAVGTRAIALFGDAGIAANNWFGQSLAGLGPFYTGGIPALVVGAGGPLTSRVYAFKGGATVPSTLQVSNGETFQGSTTQRTGTVVNPLGSLAGVPALGVSSPGISTTTGGDARVFFGNPASGVFSGTSSVFTNSAATSAGDGFSTAFFGGGFSGSTVNVSFINGPQPDIAISSVKEAGAIPTKLYIIDGVKAGTSADVATAADVAYTLPSTWAGAAYHSGPLRDSNGDGYADLAVGEQKPGAYDGRVLVLW